MIQRLILCTVISLPFFSEAQSFYAIRRDRPIQVNVGTGISSYYGDLVDPGDVIDTKLNLTVGAQFTPYINWLENRFHARAALTWFQLEGDDKAANDPGRQQRNLSFISGNVQLTATGALDFFPTPTGIMGRPLFNFYGLTGIGLLYINPKAVYNGEKIALQPLQTEGVKYSRFQFVVPYGLGARVKTGTMHNISIEAVWHKTFTDRLDDIGSRNYAAPASLSSDLSRSLSDRRGEIDPSISIDPTGTTSYGVRGNPSNNDSYMLLNIKFEYYLATKSSQRSNFNRSYRQKRKSSFNPGRRR